MKKAALKTKVPPYIAKELKTNAQAKAHFEQLAPSCRREYIDWIDSAKRDETSQRLLRKAIEMLAAGRESVS